MTPAMNSKWKSELKQGKNTFLSVLCCSETKLVEAYKLLIFSP